MCIKKPLPLNALLSAFLEKIWFGSHSQNGPRALCYNDICTPETLLLTLLDTVMYRIQATNLNIDHWVILFHFILLKEM